MNPFRYTQPNDTDSTKSISILLLAIHELTHFFISEHDSRFAYIHDEILKSCIEEFYSNPVKTVSCVENAIGGVFPEHEKEPLIRSIEKI